MNSLVFPQGHFSGCVKSYSSDTNINQPYTLLCGDAAVRSCSLQPKSIQSIITSPPYWGLRCYGAPNEIGAEATIEDYLDNLSRVFSSLKRALANDGTLWLIIGDGYTSGNRSYRDDDSRHSHRGMSKRPSTPDGLKPKDLIGLAWRVAFRLQSDGWYLRSESIWHKSNPIPESVKDRPHQSHEHIFLFSKKQKYFFDWEQLRKSDSEKFRPSRSVWTTSVNTGIKGHAAPFPVELIKPCIMSSTRPGDIILDPFSGSGSVGVACFQAERKFIGIELIEENCTFAHKRLLEATASRKAQISINETNKPKPHAAASKDLPHISDIAIA